MASKSDIKQSPIDFIYCWADNNVLNLVSKYISPHAALSIKHKKTLQQKVLAGAYRGYANIDYAEVAGWIKEDYGLTPSQILSKLILGEEVAGKNWKEGVFGVGATKVTAYKENPNVLVDTDTGKLINSGSDADDAYIEGGTPIYANKGVGKNKTTYISGYSYELNGKVYTTKLSKDGKYYAYSYGDSNGMYTPTGSEMKSSDFSSVWENIETSIPYIDNFLKWIYSVLQSLGLVKKENELIDSTKIVPQQSEFLTQTSDVTLSSVAIVGMALLGGMLFFGGNKKKK